MLHVTRIRRPPGGGHFLYGLGHAQTWLLVVVLVVVIGLAIYYRRH